MDFATDALIDSVAPSGARPITRAHESSADSGPSFEQHLAAETEAPSEPTQAPSHNNKESAKADAGPQTPEPMAALVTPPIQVAPATTPLGPALTLQVAPTQPQSPPPPQQATTPPDFSPPLHTASQPQWTPVAPTPETGQHSATHTAPRDMVRVQATPTASHPPPTTAQTAETPATTPPVITPTPTVTPPPLNNTAMASNAAQNPAVTVQAAPMTPRLPNVEPQSEGGAEPTTTHPAEPRAGKAQHLAKAATGPNNFASPSAGGPTLTPPQALDAPSHKQAQTAMSADSGALPQIQSGANHATHAVAEHAGVRIATASAQVGREIIRRFDGGHTRFELRLDPPELGRVEVRLEVTRDHRVTAVISADTPQALTELARGARELEQSLQAAGLDLGEDGLSFDLRQQQDDAGEAGGEARRASAQGESEDEAQNPVPAQTARLERWRGARIDVMA